MELMTSSQKVDILEKYSKEQIRLEKKKCILGKNLNDNTGYEGLLYFIEHYIWIKDPNPTLKFGERPFILWDFQHDVIKSFLDYRYNIILKSRQIGCSTIVSAYISWLTLFFSNKEVLILANKHTTSIEMVSRMQYALSRLPRWMIPLNTSNKKHELKTDAVQTLEFYNDSKVKAKPTTEDAGRSSTLSLLIVDEAAFIDQQSSGMSEKIWTAAEPTLTQSKGRAIILSTPDMANGWFFKMWQDAKAGLSTFNPIELGWELMPDRDDEWARKAILQAGGDKKAIEYFKREYACQFSIGSISPVVESDVLKYYLDNYIMEPKQKLNFDNGLWIWKAPEEGHQYLISADIASGSTDGDFSAFHVIDIDTLEVIAEYEGRITTDKFSEVYLKTAITYNNAYATFENNAGWSESLLKTLKDYNYTNIYHEPKPIHKNQATTSISDITQKAGFSTTGKVRTMIIDEMVNSMRKEIDVFEMGGRRRELIWHSERLYNEFLTFQYNSAGKPIAMNGFHDDGLIALAIGYHCRWNIHQMNNIWKYGTKAITVGKMTERGLGLNKNDANKDNYVNDDGFVKSLSVQKMAGENKKNPFAQRLSRNIMLDNSWVIDEESRANARKEDDIVSNYKWYEEL